MSYRNRIDKLTRETINNYAPVFLSASGLKDLKAGLHNVMEALEKIASYSNSWHDNGGYFFFKIMRDNASNFTYISEKFPSGQAKHVVPLIILDLVPSEWPPKFKGSIAYAVSYYFQDQVGPWDVEV